MRNIIKKTLFVFDHIHAGGRGGQFPPPLLYSKSIGLRLLNIDAGPLAPCISY